MLAKNLRLSSREEIEFTKTNGQLLQSDNFSLIFIKTNNIPSTKFGVIVSKKISSKAVIRNEVKRKAKRLFLSTRDKFQESYLLLLLPKKTFGEVGENELNEEWGKVIYKLMND